MTANYSELSSLGRKLSVICAQWLTFGVVYTWICVSPIKIWRWRSESDVSNDVTPVWSCHVTARCHWIKCLRYQCQWNVSESHCGTECPNRWLTRLKTLPPAATLLWRNIWRFINDTDITNRWVSVCIATRWQPTWPIRCVLRYEFELPVTWRIHKLLYFINCSNCFACMFCTILLTRSRVVLGCGANRVLQCTWSMFLASQLRVV